MGILRSSFKRSKAPACKRKEHSVMFRLWKTFLKDLCVSQLQHCDCSVIKY